MSTRPIRYDAVLFDVGGTLLGFTDWRPFQELLAEAGKPATEDDGRRLLHAFRSALAAHRDAAQGLGGKPDELERWWRSILASLWPAEPQMAQAMFRALRADRFDRAFDDVVPTLDALRDLGMPMAVISNFPGNLERLLERVGLRAYFDFVVVSELVGIAKPDPRIFDAAVALAGRARDRLLYVGDHVGDDIEGARGAGLDAVLIDRGNHSAAAPCARIRSLASLVTYIREPDEPARAVLFDLDGVVLDSTAGHVRAWQETLSPLGIQMTREDLVPLEGMPSAPMAAKLTELLAGRACSADEAARLAATKRALFVEFVDAQPIPGIVPLLHNVRGRGYRVGLVTGNAGPIVSRLLPLLGVDGLFDTVVTAEDTACGKPDPAPYLVAAQRLGLAPSECLVVENAPLGVQSAKAAGMRCAALETTLPASRLGSADRVFPDVAALSRWLVPDL